MDREALRQRLQQTPSIGSVGRVLSVTGLALRVRVPGVRVGDLVVVSRRGEPLRCVIVGVSSGDAVAIPLGTLDGVGADDRVDLEPRGIDAPAGPELFGRVLDGLGEPIDGRGPLRCARRISVERPAPRALERRAVDMPLTTGVRVLDGLLTLGEGQRIGVFAGPGAGKSSLLASLARGASVDAVVVALVGERGREVGEFVHDALDDASRARTVAVVATSDAAALERVAAAKVATAIAEDFRERGMRVLLLVDSITRVARALREIGLSAGEPPARRGYPPSVFAELPRLLERAGQGTRGSVTAVYSVLVEGGDMDEPVADEVRGLLDGHVVLSRELAARGHYPAVDVLQSVSRVMPRVTPPRQREAARRARELLAAHAAKRDLVALGAYAPGSDPTLDRALACMPHLERFLRQDAIDGRPLEAIVDDLESALGA